MYYFIDRQTTYNTKSDHSIQYIQVWVEGIQIHV